MTSSNEGRQIIWGTGFNDRKYVENEVIPKLADKEWLQSLPSNTLGAVSYTHLTLPTSDLV